MFYETTTELLDHPHPYRAAPSQLFDDELRVPYRGETRMRLASSGLAHARIVVDPAAQDLIAVHCGDGPAPRLRVVAGEIALSWRSASFGDWLRGAFGGWSRDIAIVLHPAVEWSIAIRGGLAHAEIDAMAGKLARLELSGGCCDVRFALPQPKAVVPIRISGGACRLTVQRPAEAGVALAATGGMAALRLDDQRFGALGGPTRLQTYNVAYNVASDAPRYELQLSGGAADLTIERHL